MKKRVIAAMLTAALCVPLTASAAYCAGDVDGNGVLDAFDLAMLKRDFMAASWEKQFDGDVDGSGKTTVNDLTMMQDYLLGRTSALSPQLSESSVQLGADLQRPAAGGVMNPDDYTSMHMDFAERLFRQTAQNEENTMISPLSVMTALSMTANGADEQTLAEMEEVLGGGMSMDELNSWLMYYTAGLSNELNAANSIWFRDTERFTVSEEFLQTNINFYDADIYKAPFDQQTLSDINLWTKKNTDGMIPKILEQLKDEDLMVLINAIAFDASWEEQYSSYQVQDGTFTSVSGVQQKAEMMHSEETIYYDFGNAQGFGKDYDGYGYRFVAILPEEGMTVSEWIAQMDGDAVLAELKDSEYATVVAQLPKFNSETTLDLGETLKQMGMPTAFDRYNANFSRMGESDNNISIGKVLHKTVIDLNEDGTRAAAVTAVIMNDGAAMPPEETYYITLDRPFIYMIVDRQNSLPVFMGTVQTLN